MNIRGYLVSTVERCQYTQFFKYKSTDVNLLLSGLFVRQNGRLGVIIGQIACQSNSLRRVNWTSFVNWPEILSSRSSILVEAWDLWGTIYVCVFFSCLNEHFHPFSRWSLFRYKCQWWEAKTLVWLSEKQGQENRALAHINQWTPWFRVQWLRGSLSSGCPDARPFPTWCPCKAQQPVMDGSTLQQSTDLEMGASICSHIAHLLDLLYFFWCWACSLIVWLDVAFGLI